MQTNPQNLVSSFINQVWNNRNFKKLEEFIHPEFKDHSLPADFPEGKEGLQKWMIATSAAFEHNTFIEDQVTEGSKTVIKIRMELKHIGSWRGIEPTGMEVSTIGYRLYRIADGKIIEHWGLIDGQTIENKLKKVTHGCKIAQ